jgi:hypothetical protein
MLRAIFAFVGILIVVAIVGQLGKTQMQLFSGSSQSATRVMNTDPNADVDAAAKAARDPATRGGRMDVFPGAAPAEPLNVQQQSINIQNQVRDRVQQNLQQGVQRSNNAQQ